MKEVIIGYTAGVFDLFHLGHLNHLAVAKGLCDYLIVAVSSDEMIKKIKKKKNVTDYYSRARIIQSCRYVNAVIKQEDFDRFNVWKNIKFDITFIGDDWYNISKWKKIEKKLENVGVRVVYLPYTKGVSSTSIKEFIKNEY